MKKLGILIVVFALFSCKQETKVDYIVLSGTISNSEKSKLELFNSADTNIKEEIAIDGDGKFADTLKLEDGIYYVQIDRSYEQIHLAPGINLTMNADAKDFNNTLKLSGDGVEASNYLVAKAKKKKELVGSGVEVYKLEESEFKAKFADLKTAHDELLASFEGLTEEFEAKEKRNLNYAYLNKLMNFEQYHKYYAKKPDYKQSENFLDELEGLDYNNGEDFGFFVDYKNLVNLHYFSEAKTLEEEQSINKDIAYFKVVGSCTDEKMKNKLLYSYTKRNITNTKDLEGIYKLFSESSANEDQLAEITELYNKHITISKGNTSPKFVNYENYAGGSTSLDDLKGKYVYIDVWATWCGPCKREIPFLKEIESKYHDSNIEFVSISIDKQKDHEKWKTMIKGKELSGIQLFADNDWNSQFVKDYLITGIPRFILIDPEGNIVTSSAPRPSNEKLVSLFEELEI